MDSRKKDSRETKKSMKNIYQSKPPKSRRYYRQKLFLTKRDETEKVINLTPIAHNSGCENLVLKPSPEAHSIEDHTVDSDTDADTGLAEGFANTLQLCIPEEQLNYKNHHMTPEDLSLTSVTPKRYRSKPKKRKMTIPLLNWKIKRRLSKTDHCNNSCEKMNMNNPQTSVWEKGPEEFDFRIESTPITPPVHSRQLENPKDFSVSKINSSCCSVFPPTHVGISTSYDHIENNDGRFNMTTSTPTTSFVHCCQLESPQDFSVTQHNSWHRYNSSIPPNFIGDSTSEHTENIHGGFYTTTEAAVLPTQSDSNFPSEVSDLMGYNYNDKPVESNHITSPISLHKYFRH